ncbi:hypothetical protein TNIN_492571 [Trichonephila inaurata madagascariensis]|uniref:Uncharacterized protein n=1 Tax=Trichonephila inaurata madagascariensis TaxID=2747483 RepID=A0A8X7CC18_9ARAC|nr:hypothetical protein TNIN_492571 [Trichonephila inaurata madagascariensis]
MTAILTLSESFVSGMDWEDTEVHVEEMEWEPSYIEVSEPMDWEDIPQVRASKRSKVSEPLVLNVTLQDEAAPPVSKKVSPSLNLTSLQDKATPPQPEKVSSPLESKPNLSLQVKLTSPTPPKVSPFTSEFIRHKIRCKPKVSIPEVSAPTNRVILQARRPALPRI